MTHSREYPAIQPTTEHSTRRKCSSCGAPRGCVWSIDAWVCRLCGDEWTVEHNPVRYAPPPILDNVTAK